MFSKKKVLLTVAILLVAMVAAYFFLRRKEGFGAPTKITYFYLPGCPWCEKFMPEWTKFEGLARQQGFVTEKVNGKEKPELAAQKNVRGYPTILMTKNGKDIEYQGDRKADALLTAASTAP